MRHCGQLAELEVHPDLTAQSSSELMAAMSHHLPLLRKLGMTCAIGDRGPFPTTWKSLEELTLNQPGLALLPGLRAYGPKLIKLELHPSPLRSRGEMNHDVLSTCYNVRHVGVSGLPRLLSNILMPPRQLALSNADAVTSITLMKWGCDNEQLRDTLALLPNVVRLQVKLCMHLSLAFLTDDPLLEGIALCATSLSTIMERRAQSQSWALVQHAPALCMNNTQAAAYLNSPVTAGLRCVELFANAPLEVWETFFAAHPTLTQFGLFGGISSWTEAHVSAIAMHCSQLESLRLQEWNSLYLNHSITSTSLLLLLRACPRIHTLSLSNMGAISIDVLDALARMPLWWRHRLRFLDLGWLSGDPERGLTHVQQLSDGAGLLPFPNLRGMQIQSLRTRDALYINAWMRKWCT